MTPFSANPFVYIFSIVLICGVVLYFGYSSFDKMGLETKTGMAKVVGKTYTPSGSTYRTVIVDGRSMTQPLVTPETYAISLQLDSESTVGLVDADKFESITEGDTVEVKYSRTRFSGKLVVTEIVK